MNGVIGRNNSLPWNCPQDLQHFKNLTSGGVVVMGRKTFASIGRPLLNRTNVVLSNNSALVLPEGVQKFSSVEKIVENFPNFFVIGGSQVYGAFLPVADVVIRSLIPVAVEDGDAFFPQLDKNVWKLTTIEQHASFTVEHFHRRKDSE